MKKVLLVALLYVGGTTAICMFVIWLIHPALDKLVDKTNYYLNKTADTTITIHNGKADTLITIKK